MQFTDCPCFYFAINKVSDGSRGISDIFDLDTDGHVRDKSAISEFRLDPFGRQPIGLLQPIDCKDEFLCCP